MTMKQKTDRTVLWYGEFIDFAEKNSNSRSQNANRIYSICAELLECHTHAIFHANCNSKMGQTSRFQFQKWEKLRPTDNGKLKSVHLATESSCITLFGTIQTAVSIRTLDSVSIPRFLSALHLFSGCLIVKMRINRFIWLPFLCACSFITTISCALRT